MRSGNEFRPAPPPQFRSHAFDNALHQVKQIAETRSEADVRIAHRWADGSGTPTPPGHWNQIATELIRRYGLSEERAVEVLALMNMALMDAGISCWEAKYTYWLIRPSQVDTTIATVVELPNFPSYTSGHASFSGAASDVLAAFFPSESGRLRATAEEAAFSRVLAGLHYTFDSEAGLWQGRAVARLALERRADLMQHPPRVN